MKRISVPVGDDEKILLERAADYRNLSLAALAKRYIENGIAEEIVMGVLQ